MTISIAVMNQSTVVKDDGIIAMMPALMKQWNRDMSPVWHIDDCTMTFIKGKGQPAADDWWLVFLDDSNQAGALAYHDLTPQGLPLSKVFCRTIIEHGESVSVAASHELMEMAVDPTLNLSAQAPNGRFYAYEVCDPCEADDYAYEIDGVMVSDFVTPTWFQPRTSPDGAKFSFKGNVLREFDILPGGYAQWYNPLMHSWHQVLGHEASPTAINPQPGSRRERRTRNAMLRCSECFKK